MKKLIVLFVALAVATGAFAADFSFSWDTDWGWASNFDDEYSTALKELELAIDVDIDEYNSFSTEFEPIVGSFDTTYDVNEDGTVEVDGSETETVDITGLLAMNKMKITTDLGAFFGLSGISLSWTNGYFDAGDQEYADQFNVGNQFVGMAGGTDKDWMTALTIDAGTIAIDVDANWDVAGVENDGNDTDRQYYVSVYSAETLVPGLSVEANYYSKDNGGDDDVDDDSVKSVIDFQAVYVYDMAPMTLTFAGEFGTDMECDSDYNTTKFGAGAQLDYAVDDELTADVSVSFAGDDKDTLRAIGGGVSLYNSTYGADVDMNYAPNLYDAKDKDGAYADGDLLYTDISGWMKVGAAKFRVGYAVTDFAASNNSRATVAQEGGAYMKFECDF